jgi:hypothetical protein
LYVRHYLHTKNSLSGYFLGKKHDQLLEWRNIFIIMYTINCICVLLLVCVQFSKSTFIYIIIKNECARLFLPTWTHNTLIAVNSSN